jgi:hypothetical protein
MTSKSEEEKALHPTSMGVIHCRKCGAIHVSSWIDNELITFSTFTSEEALALHAQLGSAIKEAGYTPH